MSSTVNPQPENPADEELVAYLDGELAPEECRRVETRLAADAGYRQQLHDLDRAWDALDSLPTARIDDDFARTTMEMVAVAAEGDLTQHTVRAGARSRRRALRWFGAAALAMIVGFALVRLIDWRREANMLADLPVVRQVDVLPHIDDIEFLRRLPGAVPLDVLAGDESVVGDDFLNQAWSGAPSFEDRRVWVEARTTEQKAELVAQSKRFAGLPRAERDRLRDLQRQIAQADDAAQLQNTLLAYGQWLSRLTLGEQEELKESLKDASVDEQLDHVRRLVRRENQRASRQLSGEDAERLRRFVLQLVDERRTMMMREMGGRGAPDRARRLEGPRGAMLILSWTLQSDAAAADEARDRIVDQLSADAQAHLDRLGPRGRQSQLWQWIRDSLQPKWGAGELEQFFANELDNDERERLLNLPPGQMQAELERMYVANEFGFRGGMEPGRGPWSPMDRARPDMRPERRLPERFDRGLEGPRGRRPDDRGGPRPPSGPVPPPPPRPERRDAI